MKKSLGMQVHKVYIGLEALGSANWCLWAFQKRLHSMCTQWFVLTSYETCGPLVLLQTDTGPGGSCELDTVLPCTMREDNEGGTQSAPGQDGYRSLLKSQLLLAPDMLWTSPEHQDNLFLSAPLLLPAQEAAYWRSDVCHIFAALAAYNSRRALVSPPGPYKQKIKKSETLSPWNCFGWTKLGAFSAWQAFSSASRKEKYESIS